MSDKKSENISNNSIRKIQILKNNFLIQYYILLLSLIYYLQLTSVILFDVNI